MVLRICLYLNVTARTDLSFILRVELKKDLLNNYIF